MTGPEHYKEAERLLRIVGDGTLPLHEAIRAEAQIHATLALAAATADPVVRRWIGPDAGVSTDREWAGVLS